MSELDPRILSVLKEVAKGEMFTDDYGERCLHCGAPRAKDERGIFKDRSLTQRQAVCIVTIAREILEEHQEHHSIVIDISKLVEYKDNVFTCGECELDIHVSYDGRYAKVLQQTNKLSEVSHQILLKTPKE